MTAIRGTLARRPAGGYSSRMTFSALALIASPIAAIIIGGIIGMREGTTA